MRAEGYQPLCDAAKKAVRHADLPAAPDAEVYEIFKRPTGEFMPAQCNG
ncbi:cell envelope integrity TolA C-terminal domain-containing protein [Acerihabitans sp.]